MRKVLLFAKKKVRTVVGIVLQHGDVKWSAAVKGMLCSAMNVEKNRFCRSDVFGCGCLE